MATLLKKSRRPQPASSSSDARDSRPVANRPFHSPEAEAPDRGDRSFEREAPDAGEGRAGYFEGEFTHGRSQG